MRSGSTIEFISTILPPETVKPMTAAGRPLSVMTTPAAPFASQHGTLRRADRRDRERLAGDGFGAVQHPGREEASRPCVASTRSATTTPAR